MKTKKRRETFSADDIPDDLAYHQMPRDGGQIVSVTYAAGRGHLYERVYDRSSGEIKITRYRWRADAKTEFAPWNGALPEHFRRGETVVVEPAR